MVRKTEMQITRCFGGKTEVNRPLAEPTCRW